MCKLCWVHTQVQPVGQFMQHLFDLPLVLGPWVPWFYHRWCCTWWVVKNGTVFGGFGGRIYIWVRFGGHFCCGCIVNWRLSLGEWCWNDSLTLVTATVRLPIALHTLNTLSLVIHLFIDTTRFEVSFTYSWVAIETLAVITSTAFLHSTAMRVSPIFHWNSISWVTF